MEFSFIFVVSLPHIVLKILSEVIKYAANEVWKKLQKYYERTDSTYMYMYPYACEVSITN